MLAAGPVFAVIAGAVIAGAVIAGAVMAGAVIAGAAVVALLECVESVPHAATPNMATTQSPATENTPVWPAFPAPCDNPRCRRSGFCAMPTSATVRQHQDGLLSIEIRVVTLEVVELGHVVDGDVGIARIGVQEVLVVCLGGKESGGILDAGDNRGVEDFGTVKLMNVGRGDLVLLLGLGEDCRPVLGSDIGALLVEFSRVVDDGEVDSQQLSVRDLAWVVSDLHRLRMPSRACAYQVVVRGGFRAARVSGHSAVHSSDMLEDTLHTPEAAPSQHRDLLGARCTR